MKAERRHELQENALAAWLAKQIAVVKPYWQVIIAVAIVAVLGVAAFLLIRARWSAERAVGWVDYFEAVSNRDIDRLEEVADANPEATAGLWALQAAGDERLLDGTNRLYSNPAAAKLELHKAIENYESVLDRTEEPMLVRRALFGLARAHESLGELKEAKKRYEELADKFADSPIGKVAEEHIELLSRSSTKEFLTWLAKQDFDTPPATPPPGSREGIPPFGAGGGIPPFGAGGGLPSPGGPGSSTPEDESLMELPDLSDPLGIGGAAAGEPRTETPDGQTPPPASSDPDGGAGAGDAAPDSSAPSASPAEAEDTTEPGPSNGVEPTEGPAEEPTSDGPSAESPDSSLELTPPKKGDAPKSASPGAEDE